MANQITHIVLTEKIFNQIFNKFDRGAFLAGTVFPDIRYLEVIDRNQTHFKGLSLKDVLDEQNSFMAGMKYHSLVDEVRERYVVDKNIYNLTPSSEFITQALKIYEDEVLYSKVSDWNLVISYLDTVKDEELQLVEQIDDVKRWHSLMQEYFREAPSDVSCNKFITGVGISEEIVIEINKLIDQIRQIPEIKEVILDLYEQWDLLINN